jgi:hypothetical protein
METSKKGQRVMPKRHKLVTTEELFTREELGGADGYRVRTVVVRCLLFSGIGDGLASEIIRS